MEFIKDNKNTMILILCIIIFFFIINLIWQLNTNNFYTNNISPKIIKYYEQIINLYNLSKTLESFDKNTKYLKALNTFRTKDYSNEGFLLRDFHIAGSSNSLVFQHHYNTFVSLSAIEIVLKLGARVIELNIFNSAYNRQKNGIPVCASPNTQSSYYKNSIGTFNYISLFNVCQTIKENAFLYSITDPLFLILNLNFSPNPNLCNQIANILFKNFQSHLLDSSYSYQRQPDGISGFGDIPIKNLKNKIVIISSKGFKSTDLDEIVNASWEEQGSSPGSQNNVLISKQYFTEVNRVQGLGAQEITESNKEKHSMVAPDINKKNSKVISYNPDLCFKLGFSVISVPYFTLLDSNGKQFFQELEYGSFKQHSLILKPVNLRGVQKYITYDCGVPSDWNPELRSVKVNDKSFLGGIKGF